MNTIDLNISCNNTRHGEDLDSKELRTCIGKLISLFRGTPYIEIMKYMAESPRGSLFSIRKIGRNIGLSHKNTIKYVEKLHELGLLYIGHEHGKMRLYGLTQEGLRIGRLTSR